MPPFSPVFNLGARIPFSPVLDLGARIPHVVFLFHYKHVYFSDFKNDIAIIF
jgi:hypothetical protein